MHHEFAVRDYLCSPATINGMHCKASNPATSSAFIGLAALRSGSEVNAIHHAPARSLSRLPLSYPSPSSPSPSFSVAILAPTPGFCNRGLGPLQELEKTKRDTHGQNEAEESPTHSPLHCGRPGSLPHSRKKRFNAQTCIIHLTI